MIDTLSSNCFLWKVNRNRRLYEDIIKSKRRAFWISCAIMLCLSVAVIVFLIYLAA